MQQALLDRYLPLSSFQQKKALLMQDTNSLCTLVNGVHESPATLSESAKHSSLDGWRIKVRCLQECAARPILEIARL